MASDRFVVFTTDNCKWCDKAKALLTLNDLEFKAFNTSTSLTDVTLEDVFPIREVVYAFRLKTLPQVFRVERGGAITHIGGFTELQAYLDAR